MPMCSTQTPAAELQSASFSYSDAPLIDNLDFAFSSGRMTAVIGMNGCGKTTLLKLLCGLCVPSGGRVLVEGHPLASLSHKQRARHVALMPQDTPAVTMSVQDLVLSGRYSHWGLFQAPDEADQAAVDEALRLARIGDMRTRSVRSLSGGQRQRAYLAMALAQQAELLLLDEPTSALDIGSSYEIMELVRSVQTQGSKSVIMVQHNLELALRYSDHIVVMDHGAIVAQGSPDEIVENPVIRDVFRVSIQPYSSSQGRTWCFFPL